MGHTAQQHPIVEKLDATFSEIRVVTLYALFSSTIFDEDFTDSEANVPAREDKNFDGIDYLFSGKDATAIKVDADGNTYIRVQTENKSTGTPTIVLNHDGYKTAAIDNGKITYEIALAVPADTALATSTFRIRGAGATSDVIKIFSTNNKGKVMLNGDSDLVVATLGEEFKKLIFTLDIVNGTLTAYSEDGTVIQTTAVSVPRTAPSKPATVADWFETTTSVFEWSFNRNCGVAFDNVKIYTGAYMPRSNA